MKLLNINFVSRCVYILILKQRSCYAMKLRLYTLYFINELCVLVLSIKVVNFKCTATGVRAKKRDIIFYHIIYS